MSPSAESPRAIGRYLLANPIAVGGMASVHFGRLNGPVGFRRTVAIKRMREAYATDTQARDMLLDEARVVSRVQHANVVQTLDVVEEGGELFLVLEYVHGESFDRLLSRAGEMGTPCPPRIAAAVVAGALRGLHAAHEAKGEDGQPLEVVHRDLSPHNVLVGADGVARVLDFGVARARGRLQGTRDGQLKGKLGYLSPEQVHGEASRRSDLFAAGIVLWEALSGRRLFDGENEGAVLANVLSCRVPALASCGVESVQLQAVLDQALDREPDARFATAAQMADAIEACGAASATEVAQWVQALAAETLAERARSTEALERAQVPQPGATALATTPRRSLAVPFVIGTAVIAALVLAFGLLRPPAPLEQPAPPVDTPTVDDSSGGTPVPSEPAAPRETTAAPADPAEPGVGGPRQTQPPTTPKKPPGKPPAAVAKPPDSCNPPFVIDANGVKQFKVECLK